MILLCGAPGTGKTTLAHVIARHCGYRPLEINSSDDRSVEFLRDTLSRAMQNTTLDADKRPNCVILDEIDGIDGRAPIDALIKIIKTPLNQKNSNIKDLRKSKNKNDNNNDNNNTTSFPVTRPIICICNDQYVAALKELRKYAKIFVLHGTLENRILSRMKSICLSEGLNINISLLASLCRASNGDIRSCINTLQFAAQQITNTSNSSSTSTSSTVPMILNNLLLSGLKDEQKDVYQIWKETLCTKDLEATLLSRLNFRNQNQFTSSNSSSNHSHGNKVVPLTDKTGTVTHIDAIMQIASDYGDYPIIISGLFENFLKVKYSDPSLSKTQTAAEWMSFADTVDYFARNTSNGYQVMSYVPAAIGAIHLLCASDNKIHVQWPNKVLLSLYFSRILCNKG